MMEPALITIIHFNDNPSEEGEEEGEGEEKGEEDSLGFGSGVVPIFVVVVEEKVETPSQYEGP